MVEIKSNNIPVFIGKILLMVILNYFTGYILFDINLGYIFIIIFSINFFFNIYALIIQYTSKTINILKWFDTIILLIFIILIILFFTLVHSSDNGALVIYPLGLSIICFSILLFIDIKIMKKIKKD
jgi:hypothetical protein